MKFILRAICLFAFAWIMQATQSAHAATLGWGDITATNNDTDFDMILVSNGTTAQTLAAGIYQATNFNYQFTAGTGLGGTITPLVLTSPSTGVYTVIGMGSPITYSSAGSFTTTAFGGTDTFTLSSPTTVFGGFLLGWQHWQRNPIGMTFIGGGGNTTYVRYAGANAPVLNSNTSGGLEFQSTSRRYDFSVDVQVVPEPSTLLAAGVAVVGLLYVARNRRKSV